MRLTHFTVTQIRSAATCPRILYFDAQASRSGSSTKVTRLWRLGADDATACGAIFHHAVERFHKRAAFDASIVAIIEEADSAHAVGDRLFRNLFVMDVNRPLLVKSAADAQQNFLQTLKNYAHELADIIVYARQQNMPTEKIVDRLFGDRRRRVDVTFAVGSAEDGRDEEVHVTGILDYVFSDWRTNTNRILDYKLTPADDQANDLFQAAIYALMHDVQHKTAPSAAVLYLFPKRVMSELSWDQVAGQRHKIFNLLASMAAWVRFDAASGKGVKLPGEPSACAMCPYNHICEATLGAKLDGTRLSHWNHQRLAKVRVESLAEVHPIGEKNNLEAPSATATPVKQAPPAAIPFQSMQIGRIATSQHPVLLDATVLPTHISVVGAAGSGKTWLAKIIAEETILQGVPVVAVDPQGDLVQFLHRREPAELNAQERVTSERFWERVETRVYTPGTSHGIRLALSPIRVLSDEELAAIDDQTRRDEVREEMLSGLASNLVAMAKVGGEIDCQQTFLLEVLRHLSRNSTKEISIDSIAAAVSAPKEFGVNDADAVIRKSEREKLSRKLNNIVRGPTANLYRDGVPLDLDTLITPSVPGKVPLNVIYLNALHDDEQKHFFVANLAAEIYRWMITRTSSSKIASLLFYMDEARDYIPAGTSKPPAKMPLIRLLTQGRKFGVGCLLCTQSPRSLDYNVFGNCSTKIIGRLESSQDVDRVKDWFASAGEGAPSWLPGRRGAEKGTFVGRWPGIPPELSDTPFLTRMLYSQHEGAWSPDRLEQETKSKP